jgi:hypothetical protein
MILKWFFDSQLCASLLIKDEKSRNLINVGFLDYSTSEEEEDPFEPFDKS